MRTFIDNAIMVVVAVVSTVCAVFGAIFIYQLICRVACDCLTLLSGRF